jgi:hypothetical protein
MPGLIKNNTNQSAKNKLIWILVWVENELGSIYLRHSREGGNP